MSYSAMAYRASHAATASPGQLVVLLYDGAIRFLDQAIRSYRAGDGEMGRQAVVRAERVMLELMGALDLRYELAGNLLALYRYVFERLAEARRGEDAAELERLRGWLWELRSAWAQAEQRTRMGGVAS